MVLNAAIDLKDGACTGEVATGALRSCNRAGRMAVHSRRGGASKLGHSLHRPQQSVQSQLVVHSEGGEDATVLDCADLTFNYINLFENLTGRWKKVPELCTSMERAYELSNLSWIIRKAVTFLKYMEVESTTEYFKTVVKAGGILDIVECFPWSGEKKEFPRRDKRRGKMSASVRLMQDGIFVDCEWGGPYAGKATDEYTLSEDGTKLIMKTVLFFHEANEQCEYTNVFVRE